MFILSKDREWKIEISMLFCLRDIWRWTGGQSPLGWKWSYVNSWHFYFICCILFALYMSGMQIQNPMSKNHLDPPRSQIFGPAPGATPCQHWGMHGCVAAASLLLGIEPIIWWCPWQNMAPQHHKLCFSLACYTRVGRLPIPFIRYPIFIHAITCAGFSS